VSKDNKEKIAVFDLDGTLLKGDSLRQLIARRLTTNPKFIVAAIRRAVLGGSRSDFAERVHRELLEVFACQSTLDCIVESFVSQISEERMGIVQRWKKRNAATVLLSASPEEYVNPLAKRLAIDYGFGSHWSGGRYRHLFSSEKLRFLELRFPKDRFEWSYAMSDAVQDQPLLAAFQQSDLVTAL